MYFNVMTEAMQSSSKPMLELKLGPVKVHFWDAGRGVEEVMFGWRTLSTTTELTTMTTMPCAQNGLL